MAGCLRFHIIDRLVGILMICTKGISTLILCIMERHFYLTVIRDLNPGKIRSNIKGRTNRNLIIVCCNDLVRIQLIFDLLIIRDLLRCRFRSIGNCRR